ncbi:terminase small subunit [Fischerella thermalis]|uniref:Uncharacterized protein n=1 Tax=Fischerella thermalis CCMEE 5318 TaxID=2019666 RepID=A0A2N6LPJ8_9CYAN|nr:terminase small subunit [Fischerella thermalis]PMB27801.1 hypothetical protein CEN46_00690 [Fischerella thermalis CCMEE 5318]
MKKLEEMTINELEVVAFSNITDFVTLGHTVRLKPIKEIPPEKLIAIASITQKRGETTIKLHDKVKALSLIGDYLGLFSEFNAAIAALRKYGLYVYQDDGGRWQISEDPIHQPQSEQVY